MLKASCLLILAIGLIPLQSIAYENNADAMFRAAREKVATNPTEALEMADEILRVYGNLRSDSLLAKVAYLQGTANLYMGRGFMAAEHFKHALSFDYMQQNIALQEASWNNLGIAYDIEGKLESSLEAYQKSLEIATFRNDSTSIMQSLINIGLLDKKSQNYDWALEKFRLALNYFKQHNDSLNMGLCYQNLGATYLDMRKYEAAGHEKMKALVCFDAADYLMGRIEIRINLANLNRERGAFNEANSFIEAAFELNRNFGNKILEGNLYNHLAANQIQQRNYRQAESSVQRAMQIYEEYPNLEFQIFTVQIAMRLYAHTGNIAKYTETEEMLNQLSQALQTENNIKLYNQLTELCAPFP